MKQKLTKLEAIRGFAAIYVLLHHIYFNGNPSISGSILHTPYIGFLLRFGKEAVMLFFILSGFVIKLSFERSKDKSFSSYLSKRFLRIYVPLICVFITNYLLFSYYNNRLIDPQWDSLIKNLLMLQDTPHAKHIITTAYLHNSPLWSLSFEWWFYMSFYLLIYFFKDNAKKIVFVLTIISAATYVFYPFFINKLYLYFAIWWAGVEIAELYLKNKTFNIQNLKLIFLKLIICLLILVGGEVYNRYYSLVHLIKPIVEIRSFFFAIFIIIIAILWKKVNWKYFNFTAGLFTIFAPISYTVYISHYFLVANRSYLNFIPNFYLQLFVAIAVCFAYSYVVELIIYMWIKQISMRGKKKQNPQPAINNTRGKK